MWRLICRRWDHEPNLARDDRPVVETGRQVTWLNPGRLVLYGALIAALLFGLVALDKSRQAVGYGKAQAEYAVQAKVADENREAVAAPIVEKEAAAQVQIRTITKKLIEKVNVYVPMDTCVLPPGYRRLHDAAVANVEIPDAASVPDGAAVPADAAAKTLVENYGIAHVNAERLKGLQEWVRAQAGLN